MLLIDSVIIIYFSLSFLEGGKQNMILKSVFFFFNMCFQKYKVEKAGESKFTWVCGKSNFTYMKFSISQK